jgi:hypothetical protein
MNVTPNVTLDSYNSPRYRAGNVTLPTANVTLMPAYVTLPIDNVTFRFHSESAQG